MKRKLYSGHIFLAVLILVCGKLNAQFSPPWEWIRTLSSTGGIYGKGLTIDRSGDRSRNIYAVGGFEGTVDFDPGEGIQNITSNTGLSAFISKIDEAGNLVWTKALLGTEGKSYAGHIAIDPADGAIYTTGRFLGTIDFDPGEGILNISSSTPNCSETDFPYCGDNFISKLDVDGNFLWTKVIWGTQDVFISSLAIDPGGNGDVYTTGAFRGTVDFDPGLDIFNVTSAGNDDIFISKLNSSGDFQWAKRIGGQGNDYSYSIAIDPTGNGEVYTTGYFARTVDFNPGTEIFNLASPIGQSIFISKLNGTGNFIWAKQLGRAGDIGLSRVGSIALDPAGSGDVYATGGFQGKGDFDPGDDGDDTCHLTSVGDSDIFISKLDSTGNFILAKAMGGTDQDYGVTLGIQPGESGNIYIIGRFEGTADCNPGIESSDITSDGDYDIFISKLDNTGNFKWVKAIKGLAEEYIADIAIDQESLYLSGFFHSDTVSFDATTISNINTLGTGPDLFIAKLDIDFTISTEEINKHTINLYPNPATDEVNIEFDGDDFRNVEITLFNTIGEVVYFGENETIVHNKTIDISLLSTGIYFMAAKLDGEIVMKKIVKE